MQFQFRGKNVDITQPLKEYVERKIGKLEKYFDSGLETSALVTMSVERGRHIVEVTMPIDGLVIRGEEETQDMYASVDLVSEKLERQVIKYRTRILRRLHKPVERGAPAGEAVQREKEEEVSPEVVRHKKISLRPMDVEEAIMQMNLVGHDFFLFVNGETGLVNVLYRRKDGNYGLIEAET